ncbi:MAG: hypothetical protein V4714_00790 [Bacteroidota bacterium]
MARSKLSILLLLVPFLHSCRVAPVQLARINLSESFCQSFDFEGSKEEKGKNIKIVLTKLLGSENYTTLEKLAANRLEDIKNGLCESCGSAVLQLSIVPNSIKSKHKFQFFVSGSGRYFIILKTDNQIYYTADFYFLEEHHESEELQRGLVIIRFKQRLINHLAISANNIDSYSNDEIIEVHIKIDTSLAKKGIYSIDYENQHEVRVDNKFIGYLRFEPPDDKNDKLMDLRGLRYLRNRY